MIQDSGAGIPGLYWYPSFLSPVNKTRSYAKTGHYDNVKRRTNYHLLTGSKVTKILLNGTTAYGVTFAPVAAGSKNISTVKANKEVILAAGAIHTPKIMQLSGLGPKTLLDLANITTAVDLPGVGQNFQDHPILQSTFACKWKIERILANSTQRNRIYKCIYSSKLSVSVQRQSHKQCNISGLGGCPLRG